jgi:NhaA family Na+:H+ antiporter
MIQVLTGVLLAFTIPLRTREPDNAPLRRLEHDLHAPVAYAILPLFAFANSGIDFGGMNLQMIAHPVPLGIAAGLFVGKQIGVFVTSALLIGSGLARMPEGVGWGALYGVSILCGIGFTMSLFVASLAFPDGALPVDERIGIMLGSLLSAVAGYLVLRLSAPPAGSRR